TTYQCELSGELVGILRNKVKFACPGLPIVIMQFAKIISREGTALVQGIEKMTKIYVNPPFVEAIFFRLVLNLSKVRSYLELGPPKNLPYISKDADFDRKFRLSISIQDESGSDVFVVYDDVMHATSANRSSNAAVIKYSPKARAKANQIKFVSPTMSTEYLAAEYMFPF
ncbi:hypothetical protein A2U01_0001369, partial [Trifolium medium]|nr:hypothetical protein [Trifolium medium]